MYISLYQDRYRDICMDCAYICMDFCEGSIGFFWHELITDIYMYIYIYENIFAWIFVTFAIFACFFLFICMDAWIMFIFIGLL